MGFSSSVNLMVRLGVFFDVHSPLWVAVQLHYRQQSHGFGWVSAALAALQFIVACATGRCMLGNLGAHLDLITSLSFLPCPPIFCIFASETLFPFNRTPGNDAPPQERPKGRSSQTDDPRSFRRFGAGYFSNRLQRLWQCHSGKCTKSSAGYRKPACSAVFFAQHASSNATLFRAPTLFFRGRSSLQGNSLPSMDLGSDKIDPQSESRPL